MYIWNTASSHPTISLLLIVLTIIGVAIGLRKRAQKEKGSNEEPSGPVNVHFSKKDLEAPVSNPEYYLPKSNDDYMPTHFGEDGLPVWGEGLPNHPANLDPEMRINLDVTNTEDDSTIPWGSDKGVPQQPNGPEVVKNTTFHDPENAMPRQTHYDELEEQQGMREDDERNDQ